MDEPIKCHECDTQYAAESADATYIGLHGLCPRCVETRPACRNCFERFPEDELVDGLCCDCHVDTVAPEHPGSRVREREEKP